VFVLCSAACRSAKLMFDFGAVDAASNVWQLPAVRLFAILVKRYFQEESKFLWALLVEVSPFLPTGER
jgi:hypothetical protein